MLKGCRWTSLVQFSKKRMYSFLLQSKQPQISVAYNKLIFSLCQMCRPSGAALLQAVWVWYRQLHVSFSLLDQHSLGWMIFMVNGSTRGGSGHRMPFKLWVCTYQSLPPAFFPLARATMWPRAMSMLQGNRIWQLQGDSYTITQEGKGDIILIQVSGDLVTIIQSTTES